VAAAHKDQLASKASVSRLRPVASGPVRLRLLAALVSRAAVHSSRTKSGGRQRHNRDTGNPTEILHSILHVMRSPAISPDCCFFWRNTAVCRWRRDLLLDTSSAGEAAYRLDQDGDHRRGVFWLGEISQLGGLELCWTRRFDDREVAASGQNLAGSATGGGAGLTSLGAHDGNSHQNSARSDVRRPFR
jgi:hypothetical protein